jgi:16S rRNA (guanine527-N7)-methyltransferase
LATFTDLVVRWNSRINLVGRADIGKLHERHILDALQLADFVPPGILRAVDLGSGAGFPGLVLAIATGVHFDLIESDQRKAAFLREAARITAAPAKVHACRIEVASVAPADLVTARALAPLPDLLPLAHRFLSDRGVALFPKGASADQELTGAAAKWNMRIERFPSQTDAAGVILRLSEVRSV